MNRGTQVHHISDRRRQKYKKNECLSSFKRIIHECDNVDDDNLLSWKRGGSWQRGQYEYQLDNKRKIDPGTLRSLQWEQPLLVQRLYNLWLVAGTSPRNELMLAETSRRWLL